MRPPVVALLHRTLEGLVRAWSGAAASALSAFLPGGTPGTLPDHRVGAMARLSREDSGLWPVPRPLAFSAVHLLP